MSVSERLKAFGRELGCDLVGITSAETARTYPQFLAWLEAGYAGAMEYMRRHAFAREHPRHILATVRSIVLIAVSYHQPRPHPVGQGRIASYACRADYHHVLWDLLDRMGTWLRGEVPGCQTRSVVDSAPLLERDFAQRAGLGWFGKNTMLLHPHLGSYFFLGALLTSADLPPDPPFATDHCGTCTACLDACPTQAFPSPGVLDARRCISFLTIELKGHVPVELRPSVGEWLFGCDICQEVCPWNQKAQPGTLPALAAKRDLQDPDPIAWLQLSPDEFREHFRGTPLTRPKRRGLLRNACLVLGNLRRFDAEPMLIAALEDEEPLIRGAAAWALGQLATGNAARALEARLSIEQDEQVRAELAAALQACASRQPPGSTVTSPAADSD
jgi:epoxyqueuosine reductase